MILVTGGAGFVGSNFVLQWIAEEKGRVVNIDKLTSAGNLNNLSYLEHHNAHKFIRGDIRNRSLLHETLKKYRPIAIVNCAAETHAERSINHPDYLIQTNVVGTFDLLEETLAYWKQLDSDQQKHFRFLHLSSDEVYGLASLQSSTAQESSLLNPHHLFAASKASADQLIQTYHLTHGLPTLIARSPNNFGPYQFPDKLVPFTIINALQGNPIPIYGDGSNTRAWIHVSEHCTALRLLLKRGQPGEIYNVGEQTTLTTKTLIENICRILDETDEDSHKPHINLVKIFKDKPHHNDTRYTLECDKLHSLGWNLKESFEESLRKTIHWYLHHMSWVENVVSGDYRAWIQAIKKDES